MDTNALIRKHLPERYEAYGRELYLRLDAAVELIRLARLKRLTLLGVEYFCEVPSGHAAIGVDYWPQGVPAADRLDELAATWAEGFPLGATLVVFGFR